MLPKSRITRYIVMTDTLETLRARMDAAARALDFEEAKRLRDMISLIRNGATAVDAEQADLSGEDQRAIGTPFVG